MHRKTPLILLILIIATLSLANAQKNERGTVKGSVRSSKDGTPVSYAQVQIYNTDIGTMADSLGEYRIDNAPLGYHQVQVVSLNFKTQVSDPVQITASLERKVDLFLEPDVQNIDAVRVSARSTRRAETPPTSTYRLNIQEIEKSPGGVRDISKVVQNLPGVAATPLYRNDLIVRGGGPNENKFYLDRIEIPVINHFATQGASGGNASLINSDFLIGATLYSSAFPVSRGGAVSSVLDLKMTEGNSEKIKAKFSIGASDLALTIDAPLSKKSNIIASYRRSYLQFLFSILKLPFLPTYNDAQIKYSHHFDDQNHLYIIALGSFDKNKLNTSLSNPEPDRQQIIDYLPENDQWSYVVGAVYTRYMQAGILNVIASTNRLNNSLQKWQNNDPSLGKNLDYRSNESEIKLRTEYNSDLGKGYMLGVGMGYEHGFYDNNTFRRLYFADQVVNDIYRTELNTDRYFAFASIDKSYFNNKFRVMLSLRMDGNSYSSQMSNPLDQLSPRLALSYAFAPKWQLNANVGRYYQEPSYTTMGYRNKAGEVVNRANGIRYIASNQATFGISFAPNNDSRISVEGFYKGYSDYPVSLIDSTVIGSNGTDVFAVGAEPVRSNGVGRAYGAEFMYRNNNLWGNMVSVAYTYFFSEFRKMDANFRATGPYIPSSWDYRHLISVVFMRNIGKGWEAGIRWRFSGGAPYTPYDMELSSRVEAWDASHRPYLDYSLRNSGRLPAFHQMDLRVDKTFFFKKWTLALYVDIQNIYNYKALGQDVVMPQRDGDGHYMLDPNRPGHYLMESFPNEIGGTIIPTFGVIIEI